MNDFRYKNLIVWQKGMQLVKQIYVLTEKLPKTEEYSLKVQMRRAAVSIVSNIAEGSGRKSDTERRRFYEISRSSLMEVDTQLEVCVSLGYISPADCNETSCTMMEVFGMLTKLIG